MYAYVPSWAIDWEYRSELLFKELFKYNSDIICLQEVDRHNYEVLFREKLQAQGYNTEYLQKARIKINEDDEKKIDGCATFYRSDKFKLIERLDVDFSKIARDHSEFRKGEDTYNRFLNRDNIAMILVLEHIGSGRLMILTNTHLHWDPAYKDVKVMQTVVLWKNLPRLFADTLAMLPKKVGNTPNLQTLRMFQISFVVISTVLMILVSTT